MPSVPESYVRTTIDVHGEAGVTWLERLPDLLASCAKRWSLTILPHFAPLTYNYVAPAVRADETEVVLKVGVPCRELSTEVEALRLFNGRGAVRLLEADSADGVLLLERLTPGNSLLSVGDDEQATRIASETMRSFWRPVPEDHIFPTVAEWFCALARLRQQHGGATGPLPARLVEEAEATVADLTASLTVPSLLHGDLHHGNILRAERASWLAVDPKGVIGDPAFEPGAFLLNPTPQSADVLRRRVAVFAEVLDMPHDRVRCWGLVRAVLSACWSLEDRGHGWQSAIAVGEALSVG